MKKALALVLALVLALSMAVSAFGLDFVTLVQVPDAPKAMTPITVVDLDKITPNDDDLTAVVYAGDTYYVALNPNIAFEDVKVTANGNTTATVVDFDPEKMYFTSTSEFQPMYILYAAGNNVYYNAADTTDYLDESIHMATGYSYDAAKAKAKELNDANKAELWTVIPRNNINIIKLVVEDNYSASYTEGTVTVTAKVKQADKTYKDYVGGFTVINDVVIFEYEMVKWAAAHHDDKTAPAKLLLNSDDFLGYSDYQTAVNGYDLNKNNNYDISELRQYKPYVVSTTAFRAIAGKGLTVSTPGEAFVVDIENVQAGQKGVNFNFYGFTPVNEDGYYLGLYLYLNPTKTAKDFEVESVLCGFYGDQVIKGDFTLTVTPGMDWFELRELFGEKIEEDDIVSYYILKDGKLVKEYKIDYMTVDPTEEVEIELELSNTTLGEYEIVLEVPSAEAEEANPNTGAESVVGVVAALAVVSLASAAAVSLKK